MTELHLVKLLDIHQRKLTFCIPTLIKHP